MTDYLVSYFDIYRFSATDASDDNLNERMQALLSLQNDLASIAKKRNGILYMFSDFGFFLYDCSNFFWVDSTKRKSIIELFLASLTEIYDKYINYNFLLRGGISFGHLSINPFFIIGPPATKAVRLEQNNTVPMILFPSFLLAELTGDSFPHSVHVPLKNSNILALPIYPTKTEPFLNLLKEIDMKETLISSEFSLRVHRAYQLSVEILIQHKRISAGYGGRNANKG